MAFDVITMGSATVDIFAQTGAEDESIIDIRHAGRETELAAYPLGAKILLRELATHTGGGGTNTATCFARLGLNTGYIGKLGRDTNAYTIMKMLKQEGITFLGAAGERSGYSFILDSHAHDRTVFTYKGANDDLRFDELDTKKLGCRWFYASSMLKTSLTTLRRLAPLLAARSIRIAFNPSSYLCSQGLEQLHEILEATSLLVLNKEEAQILAGAGEIDFLARKLHHAGARMVCITDGPRGSWMSDGERLRYLAPREVEVADSTGAGDAFAATLVWALHEGRPIEEGMVLAQINAEHVIGAMGAKQGLLTRQALLEATHQTTYRTTTRDLG